MIKLLDGPAHGAYMVKTAPARLRAVVEAAGHCDVLNLPEDTPEPSDTLHVYIRVTDTHPVHINMGRKGSGFYATGDYRWMPDVDGEQYRDNAVWSEWAAAQGGVEIGRAEGAF